MTTTRLKVYGLDCADEATPIRQSLSNKAGVQTLSFDYLRGEIAVEHDESSITAQELMAAVEAAGFRSEDCSACQVATSHSDSSQRVRTLTAVVSGGLLATGFAVQIVSDGWLSVLEHAPSSSHAVASFSFVASAVIGSTSVVRKAWIAIQSLRLDMNVLMVVAVLGAIAIEQYSEAATVAFLFTVSLALESWSVGRARRAVEALMNLAPDTACVLRADGSQAVVRASDVQVGERLLVRPGERIPVDASVESGETTVNQAPITGESLPVSKHVGDHVFAGTMNQEGAIEIVATKGADDSTLARIARLVSDAQRKRAPTEQWVESFARIYTPAVMTLALMVMLVPLVTDGSWTQWFYQGLVLLVIACPCALVISTPVSFVAALTSAAHQGVLVKGAGFLELASHLKALAFDKTGTLTVGHPTVKKVVPLSGHTEREVLNLAAAIESRSQHPLAQAIVQHAESLGIRPQPAEHFQSIIGKGATASFEGELVWIGSHRAFEQRGAEPADLHLLMEQLAADGHSIVVVASHGHVCGLIALGDKVRADAKQALNEMHRVGIRQLVMLTGDNSAAASAVAIAVGIDDVQAELLPEDKVAAIEKLIERHGFVGMVGDGVNDAPAMARATLGIAMGVAGTDTALETADVALMTDDLTKVSWLIRHSHRTLNIIRQNIIAALGVKAAFVLLTVFGHASLWSAIMADTGVSLLVVFNALRLLRTSTRKATAD